jgi:hypothetical protein
MSGNSKPPWPEKDSPNPQLSEKAEHYLIRLLATKESDAFTLEIIDDLIRELDDNPALAELFLKKITSHKGSFSPWFLLDLNRQTQSKSVQKGIRRTLYLLKQKGIELSPSADTLSKKEGGILKNIESIQTTGFLSEFDGLKNQMVGLLIPKPAKGRLFIFSMIGREGLESLTALEVSKKEVKDIIADLEDRSGHAFLEADFGHTAFILKEAHDRRSKLSKEEEGVYSGIISFLEGRKMVGQSPVIRSLLTAEKPIQSLSVDIHLLTRIPEIVYLLPEPKILETYLRTVEEVRTGLLILNEIQKRERLKAVVDRAVQELFPPETRTGLFRYLEEAAYLHYLKGQREEAEHLFHWANTLDQEKEFRPGKENPLLLWLMETALLTENPNNDLTPEQKEQKTEGGIIIPSWVKGK